MKSAPTIAMYLLVLFATSIQAATVNCTIDGNGPTPKLVYGKTADCKVTGDNGNYLLIAKKEPKFVQASCWRDGPSGDASQCTIGLVRSLPDKRTFYVGTHLYPGSGSSGVRSAWFSFAYTY